MVVQQHGDQALHLVVELVAGDAEEELALLFHGHLRVGEHGAHRLVGGDRGGECQPVGDAREGLALQGCPEDRLGIRPRNGDELGHG